MERRHRREFLAVSSAPVKNLPARPSVGLPGIPITNCGGEKVNVSFSDFGAGSSNQLRDPRLRRSVALLLRRVECGYCRSQPRDSTGERR
jgi:hypothetical protein